MATWYWVRVTERDRQEEMSYVLHLYEIKIRKNNGEQYDEILPSNEKNQTANKKFEPIYLQTPENVCISQMFLNNSTVGYQNWPMYPINIFWSFTTTNVLIYDTLLNRSTRFLQVTNI